MKAGRPVAITGIGWATSMGIGAEETALNVASGTVPGASSLAERAGAELGGATIRRMDDLTRYATLAAKLAFDDARLGDVPADERGGIFSTVLGPYETTAKFYRQVLENGLSYASPLLFPGTVTNSPIGKIAKLLDLRGVSSMLVGSCPIAYGVRLINSGKASAIIAGGMDTVPVESGESGNRLKGACLVVIEDLEKAQKRGARILGEILESAEAFDPSGVGAGRTMLDEMGKRHKAKVVDADFAGGVVRPPLGATTAFALSSALLFRRDRAEEVFLVSSGIWGGGRTVLAAKASL